MTLIYTNTNEIEIRRLVERFNVLFENVYKVEIDTTQITIYYTESYYNLDDELIWCTKVIHDSWLANHLRHA